MENKNIHSAVAKAILKIENIKKEGSIQSGKIKYNYAKIEQTVKACRDAIASEGISIDIDKSDIIENEFVTSKNKWGDETTKRKVVIHYLWKLSLSNDDYTTFNNFGEGEDSGDKAFYKAETGALKYLLRTKFLVPIDDADPDKDASEDRVHVNKATTNQQASKSYQKQNNILVSDKPFSRASLKDFDQEKYEVDGNLKKGLQEVYMVAESDETRKKVQKQIDNADKWDSVFKTSIDPMFDYLEQKQVDFE